MTTSDAFNAVAEPRRREILELLAPGERAVGDIVTALGLGQPSVSKHLQVLLNVGVERRFDPAGVPAVQEAVRRIEQRLGGECRVVLRPSGTEPVIRVMVEGRDEPQTRAAATELAEVIKGIAA